MQYTTALRELVQDRLRHHAREGIDDPSLRHAAVAVSLVASDAGEACFLLTRRASGLRAHRGQWALPGGSLDDGEDAIEAACRELDEEVGVADVEVLGCLDDYPTRSGYRITPVVVWSPRTPVLRPDPAEVESVYRIPLTELDRPDGPRFLSLDDVTDPVIQVPIHDTLVHAPTGAVLYQVREVLLHGRATRVAHYEEPKFARR